MNNNNHECERSSHSRDRTVVFGWIILIYVIIKIEVLTVIVLWSYVN